MIRRRKVHSGIFASERIEASGSVKDIGEAIQIMAKAIGLEPMILRYEEQARKVLETQGYPTTLEGLWPMDNNTLPVQIQDIKSMLFRFNEVREQVKENNAEWAAWNMGLAIHAAIRAQIRPIEPTIRKGVEFTTGRKDAYREKVINHREIREEFAKDLIRKFPTLNASKLADKILINKPLDFRYKDTTYKVCLIHKVGKDGKAHAQVRFKSSNKKFDYSMDTFINTVQKKKNSR